MIVRMEPRHAGEIPRLLVEVNHSPYIGEMTQREIDTLIQQQHIRFYYQDDQLVGFGAWASMTPDWVEIGPLYVTALFQGQGKGRQITEEIVALNQQYSQYAITQNPGMRHIFIQQGFQPVSLFRLPLALQWFLARKLTLSKLLRFASKWKATSTVSHLIKPTAPQS